MNQFRIRAVVQKGTPDPGMQLRRLCGWLTSEFEAAMQREVQVSYSAMEADIPLSFKVFIPRNEKYSYDLAGIEGLKDGLRLYAKGLEPDDQHVVIFFYQPDRSVEGLCNWTYPGPYGTHDALIEIPVQSEFYEGDRMLDVLKHETIHALHRLCWFSKKYTLDDLDSNGGNEANLARIRPHYGAILTEPLLIAAKKQALELISRVRLLLPGIRKAVVVRKMAMLIQQREGFYPGSRSYRNNNPGNLMYAGQTGAVGKDDKGFCIFASYEAGRLALERMLSNAIEGKSQVYSPSMTLAQFFAKYAPSSDGNDPDAYALFVASGLGVSPRHMLKDLYNSCKVV